jgi:hypothetical protein
MKAKELYGVVLYSIWIKLFYRIRLSRTTSVLLVYLQHLLYFPSERKAHSALEMNILSHH